MPKKNTGTKSRQNTPAPRASTDKPVAGRFSANSWFAFVLGFISIIAYANSFNNGYTIDDSAMVIHNSIVAKGIPAIPELLSTPRQRGFHEIPNDEYRPLSLVLFCIEYQFFGYDPRPFHIVNVFLFACCVVLLFKFLNGLFDDKKTALAFIASLLFALHPIHTEVVDNIKSGDELLCFLFGFLTLNIFLRYSASGKPAQVLAGFFCLFLSLLAKETAITFLAVVPVIFFLYKRGIKKSSARIMAGTVVAAVAFLAIRYFVLNYYHANDIANVNIAENALAKIGLPLESRLATAVLILGMYLKLLFIPYPLICDYSYNAIPFTHFSDPMVLISLLLYISLALFCILRFIKNRRDLYAFGIFFFLATISLFSNIPFLIKSTMGERFLFFPSVGFCLLIATVICQWMGDQKQLSITALKKRGALWLILPLITVYVLITFNRNKDWTDNLTLYSTDLKKTPQNSRLNYFVGYELFSMAKQEQNTDLQNQRLDAAITYFKKSVNIYPDYFPVADLGAAYFNRGNFDSAEAYDRKAVNIRPYAALTRNNLSGVYIGARKYRENAAFCKETIRLLPTNIYAYADIGISYLNLGLYDSSVYYLAQGIAVDPGFFGNYDVLAQVYQKKGDTDSAKKYRDISLRKQREAPTNQ